MTEPEKLPPIHQTFPEFFPGSSSIERNYTHRRPEPSDLRLPPVRTRSTNRDNISETRRKTQGGLKFIASSHDDLSTWVQPKCVTNCFLCLAHPQICQQKQYSSARSVSPAYSTTSSVPSSTPNYTTAARSLSISSCSTNRSSDRPSRNDANVMSSSRQRTSSSSASQKPHRPSSALGHDRHSPSGSSSSTKSRNGQKKQSVKKPLSQGSIPGTTKGLGNGSLPSNRSSDGVFDRPRLSKRSKYLSQRDVETLMTSFSLGMEELLDAEK